MAMFDSFYRFYWWIFNIPYYSVVIVQDMEKIKTIIQKVTDGKQGKDIAIVDRKLKRAWWKIPELCFRDGKKFIMYCDLDNAIPLVEDIKVETSGGIIIKRVTITRLKNTPIFDIKKGKPKEFSEITFPPTSLFMLIDGHFVKQIGSKPPSVWEEKKWTIIGVALVIALIVYMLLASGIFQPNQVVGAV
jgi:hypothetical protein